jgi:hypothetical protein
MRNAITTAATIRNVFANGQDAAIGTANDKRYGSRSYLKTAASHSDHAHRGWLASAVAECQRGLRGLQAAWLQTAGRLPIAAESIGQAMLGMAMRGPVAPRFAVRRVAVR